MTDLNNQAGAPAHSPNGGDAPSPKEMVDQVAQATHDQAAKLADKAQATARDKIDQGQETASRAVSDFANAVRRAADELAGSDQSAAGRIVKQAADGLEGLSRSLSDKRPEELLDSVRAFGRSNPVAFIGGSVLVGLAIGRFARSSAQHSASSGPEAAPAPQSVTQPAQTSLQPDGGNGAFGRDAFDGDASGALQGAQA